MKHRVFVSFPIPEEIQEELALFQLQLKKKIGDREIKWVKKHQFHITGVFIGNILDVQVHTIESVLLDIGQTFTPLFFRANSITYFPHRSKPKLLVIDMKDMNGVGEKMVKTIKKQLRINNFSMNDTAWRPHVTLGRVKQELEILPAPKLLLETKLEWPVNTIELVKSTLTPCGPVYEALFIGKLNQ